MRIEDENMLLESVLSGKHLLGLAKLLGQPPPNDPMGILVVLLSLTLCSCDRIHRIASLPMASFLQALTTRI
jgi:hypothetical protein